jgi:hypothetical protein
MVDADAIPPVARASGFRRHLLSSALAFGVGIGALTTVSAAFAPAAAQAATRSLSVDQQELALVQYGQFYQHPRYGHVWVPANVPQGWRPYQDCKWVYQNAAMVL